MAKLGIIVASTRPGRIGLPVAQWFEGEARTHGGFAEVDLIDLAEVALPFMNEPSHPRLGQYTHQHTKDWSARIAGVDALVFVMPEYNHGYNAELKNAIDYLHNEWLYKPVGFVSYGGVSAGLRSVQMLKQTVTAVKMMPIPEAVSIPFFQQHIDEDTGVFDPGEVQAKAATVMLDELLRWAEALKPMRG
jgi:NAD(P)H-dependent FMN reductase